MRVLVLYHSRTGTTRKAAADAARALTALGAKVHVAPLVPSTELPYPLWLILSFIPGLPWPTKKTSDPKKFDRLLLCFPKWTFNDPVVTGYLKREASRLPPTTLLVTCGGWDQVRYLANYLKKVRRLGVKALDGVAVRKKHLGTPNYLKMLDNLARVTLGKP